MEHVRSAVRAYILEELLPGERPELLKDDTPLITGGILDSISTVQLVAFLEEQFGVELRAHEMSPVHLDSVELIVETVRSKRAEA